MQLSILVLLVMLIQSTQARVCTLNQLAPPGIKFVKPVSLLKFQAVAYDSNNNMDYSLIPIGQKGPLEIFLLISERSPHHYPRFMALSQNSVIVDSPKGTQADCPECKTAARLLLHKKGRTQTLIVFDELKLPLCYQLNLPTLSLTGCTFVPTNQTLNWQRSGRFEYIQGLYSLELKIPNSEFAYSCSTMDWLDNLKTRIPPHLQCDSLQGPRLKPSDKRDLKLPKNFFRIESKNLQDLLEHDKQYIPFNNGLIPRAQLAKAYGEFCKRNQNCPKDWNRDPLLIGYKTDFGFQAVCSVSAKLSVPENFCETKDDCIWVSDCCNQYPANKNFKDPFPKSCPAVACPEDSTPPLQLECRDQKCVGVAP